MKICPKCGKENSNNSKYCVKCGEAFISEQGSGSNTAKIMTVITGALTVILIVGGVFLLLPKNTSETQPEQGPGTSTQEAAFSTTQEAGHSATQDAGHSAAQVTGSGFTSEPGPDESGIKDTRRSIDDIYTPDGPFFTYDGHTYCFYDVYTISGYGYGNVFNVEEGAYKNIQRFCKDQGGHLAVIDSEEENQALFYETQNRYDHTVFFGLSDQNREGRWVWDDGTEDTLRLWSYKYGVQQPDNGNGYTEENFAEFDYDRYNPNNSDNTGRWNDAAYLENTSVFICEWDYIIKGLLE